MGVPITKQEGERMLALWLQDQREGRVHAREGYSHEDAIREAAVLARIGLRVRMARVAAGLSREKLAVKARVSRHTLECLEMGRAKHLTQGVLAKLAHCVGRTPESLAREE